MDFLTLPDSVRSGLVDDLLSGSTYILDHIILSPCTHASLMLVFNSNHNTMLCSHFIRQSSKRLPVGMSSQYDTHQQVFHTKDWFPSLQLAVDAGER